MEEAVCVDCRSWGEELYWTHFQCTQFCQFLSSGFHQQLPIPDTFSSNLKKKLPGIVTLKGPSGTSWKVGLTTNDGTVFLRYGWEDFVTNHSLQEKDLLIFKYYGDSNFDVLMFDGQSLCEKADSYFVRKCRHEEYNGGGLQRKRKTGESSSKVAFPYPSETFANNNNIGESSVEVAPSPQVGDGETVLEKSVNNHIESSWRDAILAQVARKQREIKFSPVHLVPQDGNVGGTHPKIFASNHIGDSSVEVTPGDVVETLPEKSIDATMGEGEAAEDTITNETNYTPVHLDLLPEEEDGGTQPEACMNNWQSYIEIGPSSSSAQEGDGDTLLEKPANHHHHHHHHHIGTSSSWRDASMEEAAHKKVKREIKFTPVHLAFTPAHLARRPSYKEPNNAYPDQIEVKPDDAMRGVMHTKSERVVTEKAKADALQSAMKALSNDGFMIAMKPTHVAKKYYMSIPLGWAVRCLNNNQVKQEIILRMDGKMWSTGYIYQQAKRSGGLSSGWRSFAMNNKLQESDVCVFEPAADRINEALVLDVTIFRV